MDYNLMLRPEKVGFGEAVKRFFLNYFNFKGRASRSDYWWAFLFNIIVSLVASFIPIPAVVGLVSLVLLIPGTSLAIRRLHDTGRSWVWFLIGLIPLVGSIILIVFYCQDSDGDNQWGPGPARF